MKDAKTYEKKIKKLLTGMKKASAPKPEADTDGIELVITAILEEDTVAKKAEKAVATLVKEFVDFNEMRVARAKELTHCMGDNYVDAHDKARNLILVFNNMFRKYSQMTLAPLAEEGKREQRAILLELGMSPYVSAWIMHVLYGAHAIPVDLSLLGYLETNDLVPTGSDLKEVQKFLERIISAKDAWAAHLHLRTLVDKASSSLIKWRKVRLEELAEQARIEAERRARELREAEEAAAAAEEEASGENFDDFEDVEDSDDADDVVGDDDDDFVDLEPGDVSGEEIEEETEREGAAEGSEESTPEEVGETETEKEAEEEEEDEEEKKSSVSKKTAKKTTKKAAPKASKKTTKKASKKTAKKASKNTKK